MKTAILSFVLMFSGQIPKNDPNGVWEQAGTGTVFRLQMSGSELKVQLVEGSNPTYLKYDVNLMLQKEDPNMYKGAGSFLAKRKNGLECKYNTEWTILVVSPDQIYGKGTSIVPEAMTCEIKETGELQLDLKRKP